MFRMIISLSLFLLVSTNAYSSDLYSIKASTVRKQAVNFADYKGKALLVVNTASKCGYTPQLKGLQNLHETWGQKGLVVIGVPSNDFNQEALEGEKIAEFCKFNYGVKFTMLEKSQVKGKNKHALYKFLVANSKSPDKEVAWNFEKFLVNTKGVVVGRYPSSVKPDDKQLVTDIAAAVKK